MRIRYLLFGLLMFAFAGGEMFGSTPIKPETKPTTVYFGLSVGYNKVMHSTTIKSFPNSVVTCPSFTDGKASGFHIGGFYEQFIGEVGSAHSIIIRGLYNTFPANFDMLGDEQLSRVQTNQKDENGQYISKDVMSSTANSNEIKYSALSLDVMYKFRALAWQDVGGVVITLGPTVDFIGTKTHNQTLSIVTPEDATFIVKEGVTYTNNFRTIVASTGDIPDAKSIRFGIKVGAQLELKLPGTSIDIIPGAFYNMAFTDVNNQDWKVNAFQIGVDIRYALKF